MDILDRVLQMIIHTSLLIEQFITKTLLVWMFYTMYALIYIQKTLLPEWLVTYNSCVWTFSAMYAMMSLYISLLPEGCIIHIIPIQMIFTKYAIGAPSGYPVQWMISYKHHTHINGGRSSQTGTFNFTGIKRDASVAVIHASVSYYRQAAHMSRASPDTVNQDGSQQC